MEEGNHACVGSSQPVPVTYIQRSLKDVKDVQGLFSHHFKGLFYIIVFPTELKLEQDEPQDHYLQKWSQGCLGYTEKMRSPRINPAIPQTQSPGTSPAFLVPFRLASEKWGELVRTPSS